MSWKPDSAKLSYPCYLSLANQLEEAIVSGQLAPGSRLPPQRELADYLNLNFTTVTRAYNLCREKKLIYGVTGRGSFVAPLPAEGQFIPGSGGPGQRSVVELGIVNGFDTVRDSVLEATSSVLRKGYLDQLYSYSEPSGHLHQRSAGARWLSEMDVKTDSEHTAIFSGAQNVLSAALLALFKLGDRIATDEYTYSNLIGAARLFHIQLVPVPGDASGMCPEQLRRKCREKKIAGIFLMPNCANPTTRTMSEERKSALAAVIGEYGLVLIEDDNIGALLAASGAGYRSLFSRLSEQTVYIGGSTMNLCSGLRVAFAAFPEAFRVRLLNGLYHLNIKTSSLDAEIMTELIVSGKAIQILKQKQLLAEKANRLFEQIFPGRCEPAPRGCFFRWLPLRSPGLDGMEVERQLSLRGVNVYHSYRFAVPKHEERQYLRVSISSAGTEERLSKGLMILNEYLQANKL
ncbi:MAG: PLP-dependent aminotransferase family protein [Oligosphaeraceae bacterium]|nr:PLP-dependent aminotransferase family protein [Oligosphaeraceae bacterium]